MSDPDARVRESATEALRRNGLAEADNQAGP